MAHIKKISFETVGNNQGCTCDRCGQYIKNIYTVEFTEGMKMNYGIDCFEKLYKTGNLTKEATKILKKTIKSIANYEARLEQYQNNEIKPEEDGGWYYQQPQAGWYEEGYWTGKPYEEYRQWVINELIPSRIADKQKELAKFAKIDFKVD